MPSRKRQKAQKAKQRAEQQGPEKTVNMFVYGTLRTGGSLNGWLEDQLTEPPVSAVLHGYALFSNLTDSYPYLMKGEPGDKVLGQIMNMKFNERYQQLCSMELGAGYDIKIVEAVAGGHSVRCLAFVLPGDTPRRYFGDRIENGDWLSFHARRAKNRRAREKRRMDSACGNEWVEIIPANRS